MELEGGWAGRVVVPVRWRVRPDLFAEPASLFLGGGTPGGPARGRVVITARENLDLAEEPRLAVAGWEGVTVETRRVGPRRFLVDVSGSLPLSAGRREAELTVVAEVGGGGAGSPTQRTLSIPVSAFVAPPAAAPRDLILVPRFFPEENAMRTRPAVPPRPVRGGFTLLELLVCVGVVALLASLLLPRRDGRPGGGPAGGMSK